MGLRAVFALAPRAWAVVVAAMVACCAAALPPGVTTAVAQQVREAKRVAALWAGTRQNVEELVLAFDNELVARGWVDGRTIHLVHRFNDNRGPDALNALADETVRSNPSVILVASDLVASAVRRHTTTLPIVIVSSADPVGTGWAASLARPGGNVTGLAAGSPVIWGKRLQIMKEAVPGLRRIGLVCDPGWPTHRPSLETLTEAATALDLQLIAAPVRDATAIDAVLQAVQSQGADGLFVLTDSVTYPAQKLGLAIPPAMLIRADKVIE